MRFFTLLCALIASVSLAKQYSAVIDEQNGESFHRIGAHGIRVVSGASRAACATISFTDTIEENGWGEIKIKTSKDCDNKYQALCAGYLEGYLDKERIWQHVSNIKAINFHGKPVPEGINTYIDAQIAYINKMVVANPPKEEEQYWKYVGLMMTQLQGLTDGYNAAAAPGEEVPFREMYMHNADGDMETLLDIYRPDGHKYAEYLECSALVRMTEEGEITMGHATWRNYAAMLRRYKFYTFYYDKVETIVSFSSSPGFINSKDDFYVNKFGLGAMETTNAIYDDELYKACVPETVPSFIRSQVSNMLARSPKAWVDIFALHNSGTYNNQWMAIDLYGHGKKENVMWIVEQIPGLTIKKDVTSFLYDDGYWASYNIPYIPEIYEKSGYTKQPHTPDLDYYNCSRHNIFKRDAPKVKTMEDFKKILRQNHYKTDPLAEGNPKHTIASRYDLFEENPRHFGSIDSKITSTSLHKKEMGVWAASGPSLDDCPPFSWSEWMKKHEAVQHLGHPDVFNFDYVYMNV